MTSLVKGVVIVAAKRTPFGTNGGKLSKISIQDLQIAAAKAALVAANLPPEKIDSVNIGCVMPHSSVDGPLMPRHAALKIGVPQDRPALMVNRRCGSGFQAMINGVQDILTGVAQISLTGGAENMSQVPHLTRDFRFGAPLGKNACLEDSFWVGGFDTFCQMSMAMTAENLGAQYNLTRDEVDEFSLRSQQAWKLAQDNGRFKQEIAPVQIKIKNELMNFEIDEHPRPQTTLESLKKLPSLFKENGLVTAGSASGVCDGAGAVIVASERAAEKYNLPALARIVGFSFVGVNPSIMGIGPVPAINNLLKVTGKTLDEMDLIEINEAFGAQTLACIKELKVDLNKLNVNGGAIAMGHPVGASGARITAHLVHELRRRQAKYGIGSACIGGGQGIAVMLEAL